MNPLPGQSRDRLTVQMLIFVNLFVKKDVDKAYLLKTDGGFNCQSPSSLRLKLGATNLVGGESWQVGN